MKQKHLIIFPVFVIATGIFFLGGCASGYRYSFNSETETAIPYPDAYFAVISDIHIFDPSLGSAEAAFQKVLNLSGKMFLDSIPLMDYALDHIISSGVSFVLICGDLTKDGELINHQILAERLERLTDANIAVYVTPGNHDISNFNALKFSENKSERVPTVTADEFAQIYGKFGFNSAVLRDPNSLSYLAEPSDGLWLLSLDSNRYRENNRINKSVTPGKFRRSTIKWVNNILQKAQASNKAVMVMMHHGVVDHYFKQGVTRPAFLVRDYKNFARFLALWNVRVVFTGHYHAQDISRADYNGKYIYDIQTGSTVTPPCPIRYIELKNNVMHISSVSILDGIYPGTDFAENAYNFVRDSFIISVTKNLRRRSIPEDEIKIIAQARADAAMAHYYGDEDISRRSLPDLSLFSSKGRSAFEQRQRRNDIYWTDLPPADNNLSLILD